MPPPGSSPDASIAGASSASLQIPRTPAEQDRRRKDRLAKRQKKLEAKQRDRDHSISGQRKEGHSFTATHTPQGATNPQAVPARIVEPQNEERKKQRKRARSQSRNRDRSPSPYRSAERARSKSRGRGNGSEEMNYSRAEPDESSSDDSDDSREESRLVQGPSKRTRLDDNLERTALLTFRLRSSSSQFERVLDGIPSLATAQEHVRTKFHLGKSSVFRLSSESPLGGSVVLEDEEDFRAFKLRVLRSRAESTVITVDVTAAERHPVSARMSASTSPTSAHSSMLPPYVKQSAAQAPSRPPPMASTPIQVPAAKPKTSNTRVGDRAAVSQPIQALPPPILPTKRLAPPPAVPAAETGPYIPPSLRAKYTASRASTSSASPNIVPALLPDTNTSGASPVPMQLDPKASASATLRMTNPTKVSKDQAAKLQKGPSASQKWVEGRISAQTPCGICNASPFHSCYDCTELSRGGLSYAEERLGNLKQMSKKQAWHKSAIKDLEAVIANTKAGSASKKKASGSGESKKPSDAADEATASARLGAPAASAPNTAQEPPPGTSSAVPALPLPSSSPSPSSEATPLVVNEADNAEYNEARSAGQTTAQTNLQQSVDEEQDELAATQEMEQRQSQMTVPAAAQITPAVPVTEEAVAESAASSEPKTSEPTPNTNITDKNDALPSDADTGGPSRSERVTERQAQQQLKQRETRWKKIRKDCAAAQDKVREYLERETRGESLRGAAKYHFARNQNTLKQKTAELEELDSELSDFATKMNLQRPPRAPELDFAMPEAGVRRSPRVAGLQKSPVLASSGDAESSAAQQREDEATKVQKELAGPGAPPKVSVTKQKGRAKRLAVSSDTQAEDPDTQPEDAPVNSKGRKSLSDIAQTIDTSTTQTATPAVGRLKARVGLRTPLSEHSEDDVETSPILRSMPNEQATEKIDEQPLPPPMIQANASPRMTRRRSQTMQPQGTENENDADDELESAAEGPRPTPRSPAKRGGQAGSPTGKTVQPSASADGDATSRGGEAPSQSSTAPPSSALTLPDPSQAPSRRITRQAATRLPSSSSSGSETSDDSDDSDEEMQGGEVAAEDQAEDDDEAGSAGEEEEASEASGGQEEDEEDEIEATQIANGAATGSGTQQQARSASPASSHTRSRSNSAASSINSAASKGDKAADEEQEDVASSSSTENLSDQEEEADLISTFSKQSASLAPAPVEPAQAPRSSGIFSSFNFFQSNRNSQDVNGTKAAMTQPNGVGGRSVNGANHSASQPTPGRRPKLSMPRLSELDASVLLRRRQQPNESAASSQASTPIVATRGQHLAAPVEATDDDDEGPDEGDDDDSGSESASSSSSDSSSDSDDGKSKSQTPAAQKKGKGGGAKNVVPASKRASVAVEAKKKRKGLADLF